MKKGVSFFSFGQDADLLEAARQAAGAGYDGVELVLSESGSLNMKTSDADVLSLRREIESLGLSICAVGAWNLWENNLAGEDLKAASHAQDIIRRQIDLAALLGA